MKKDDRKFVDIYNLNQHYWYLFIKVTMYNLLAFITAAGLMGEPKIASVTAVVIIILFISLLEIFFINLFKKYAMWLIIKSLGSVLILIYIALLILGVYIVPDIRFIHFWPMIGFIVVYLLLRVLLMYYYEKYIESIRRHV